MSNNNPKLFVSYSWTSSEHEAWVINLSTMLRENGVDVILDKWELKEGYNAIEFMEKMVNDTDIKKVIMICDKEYSEKADGRKGGVGTETQIISSEVYEKGDQDKFVAIVVEKHDDGTYCVPTYYKSRINIDFTDRNNFSESFEQLLRWIYDKPLHQKPALGKKPAYIEEETSISLSTTAIYRRAVDAIKNNKDYCDGAVNEYFETFSENLENFRISVEGSEYDEQVVESIEQFLPYRNEIHDIFLALAQYRRSSDINKMLHRFLEKLLKYTEIPETITSYHEADVDNFKFIIQEIFLFLISSLIEYERFEIVAHLLRHEYYLEKRSSSDNMVSFSRFRNYVGSLDYRNKRLKLNRLTLQADFFHKRTESSKTTARKIMQADFVLYIRDCLDKLHGVNSFLARWFPDTLIFAGRYSSAFEIFVRAQSEEYFNDMKCILDVDSKEDIEKLFIAYKDGTLKIPQWLFDSINPYELMGYEKMATKP